MDTNSDDDRTALIDLDGTVADYDAALRGKMAEIRAPGEPSYKDRLDGEREPPYIEARRKLIQRQPGFWRNLAPIALGFEIVECLRLEGFGLHVLTKGPATTPSAWSEKVEWVDRHLPDALVTITSDKAKFYGRILVDDYPPYFLKWLGARPRGLVICVAQSWNADYAAGGPKESANIFRYDGTDKDKLKSLISKAYNRSSREHVFGDSETA